jgi:hypothetical protein
MGFFGSSVLANSPGMLNDIRAPSEISLPLTINSVMPFLGPCLGSSCSLSRSTKRISRKPNAVQALSLPPPLVVVASTGPIIGGYISQYAGPRSWRWVNGVIAMLAAFVTILSFLVSPIHTFSGSSLSGYLTFSISSCPVLLLSLPTPSDPRNLPRQDPSSSSQRPWERHRSRLRYLFRSRPSTTSTPPAMEDRPGKALRLPLPRTDRHRSVALRCSRLRSMSSDPSVFPLRSNPQDSRDPSLFSNLSCTTGPLPLL